MRYFLKFAYNGEKFHGWQSQPNALSVQQKIEETLSIVLRLPISVVGAGRTDAGVHAREMFAHFDYEHPLEDKNKILLSLNRLIGKDIVIYDIISVSNNAHARFDAVERMYKYFISYQKSPFLYPYCWNSPARLDLDKMNEAASVLMKVDDFSSFAKLHSDTKTNICDVRYAKWDSISNDRDKADSHYLFPGLIQDGLVFTIAADRFLRNMVRSIVGTLIDVGKNKLSVPDFCRIIEDKNRCSAGISMPPQGLFLWKVKYPYLS